GTLTFTTGAGSAALDLHGQGTQPGLGTSPAALAFGQVRTGASKQLGVTIVNTGTTAETVTGVTGPTGDFAAANLPATGTLVQGAVTVPISGVALTGQAHLTLDPPVLDFHTVAAGQSVTQPFTISNTGTVPLTITKAKAPDGVFHTDLPLAEGQVLAAGDVLKQTVTFTPADANPATSAYEITSDDGQGAQTVQLQGNTDPITDYYNQLGGARGSYLSDPVTAEYATANGGKAQDFRGGSIYWSAQ